MNWFLNTIKKWFIDEKYSVEESTENQEPVERWWTKNKSEYSPEFETNETIKVPTNDDSSYIWIENNGFKYKIFTPTRTTENVGRNIDYCNYTAENIDKNIKYTKYISESIGKSGQMGSSGIIGTSGIMGSNGAIGTSGAKGTSSYSNYTASTSGLVLTGCVSR